MPTTRRSAFGAHRNRYDVVRLNMQDCIGVGGGVEGFIASLNSAVRPEIVDACPEVRFREDDGLALAMGRVFAQTGRQFVVVIDDWDCVMRDRAVSQAGQERYLAFLRTWLKDKPYVALCYMTGILPVKKSGTHSSLNMFDEYSMLEPLELAGSMGFTEAEAEPICKRWHRDVDEVRAWCGGYLLPGVGSVFAPQSVVVAAETGRLGWHGTRNELLEMCKELKHYIGMHLTGLHGKVAELMSGAHVAVDTGGFNNDMTTIGKADDVLTLLIHLGYLAYDACTGEVFIPNREIADLYEACAIEVA